MKHQLLIVFERLKNPSVIISIASQIVTLLVLLNVNVNRSIVIGVVTILCSILTLLGIISNPSSQNIGYGDDIFVCKHCGKPCVHVMVNGKMVCCECGAVMEEDISN